MEKRDIVENFLIYFKSKMSVWDIIFKDDRSKNAQALLDLEIRPIDRKAILRQLDVNDYMEGPLPDNAYRGPDMWVFGKLVKGQEVYIKITLGAPNSNVICISFHLAEYPMRYPFRETNL